MKLLVALTIISAGVLFTKNSYAVLRQTTVTGDSNIQVSGPTYIAADHTENIADCPLLHAKGSNEKGSVISQLDAVKGSLRTRK